MKKYSYSILFLCLFFLFASSSVFSMSITYRDTPQAYDSPVLLNQFDKDKEGLEGTRKIEDIYLGFYGPGKNVYEMFGHVAIIVKYAEDDESVYDYGVFNPSEKHFKSNIVRGFMFYYLYRHFNRYTLQNQMEIDKRYVRYYKLLNLTEEKKRYIDDFLTFNYSDYRNKYLYHFFNDNCSTRLRDILNEVYDGKLKEIGSKPFGTRRTAIESQISPYPGTEMVFGIAGGAIQDKEITYYDGMFLPSILEVAMNEIEEVEFDSQNDWNVKYDYNATFNYRNSSWTPLIYIGIILFLINTIFHIAITMKHSRVWIKLYSLFNALICLTLFLLSLAMCFMQLYTTFDCAWYNQNTIFVNPLILAEVILLLRVLFSRKTDKERLLLNKTSVFGFVFTLLTLIALFLKIFLPHQANIVQIISFFIYYASLIDLTKPVSRIINFINKRTAK